VIHAAYRIINAFRNPFVARAVASEIASIPPSAFANGGYKRNLEDTTHLTPYTAEVFYSVFRYDLHELREPDATMMNLGHMLFDFPLSRCDNNDVSTL
jgi:hypothetical protein